MKKVVAAISLSIFTILFILLLQPVTRTSGFGSFLQVEYSVLLSDASGRPLKGLEVSIENQAGRQAFGYPVSNYKGRGSIKPNERGEFLFYHVAETKEFTWRKTCYLGYFCSEEGGAPRFLIKYYQNGNLIFYHNYHDLEAFLLAEHKDLTTATFPQIERDVDVIAEDGLPVFIRRKFIPFHKQIIAISE